MATCKIARKKEPQMKLNELKEMAMRVIAYDNEGEFELMSFVSRSGGTIRNIANVEVIRESCDFAYSTTANGNAESGELVTMARHIGAKDSDGRDILESRNGNMFVACRWAGTACSFDAVELRQPRFE